MFIHQCYFMSPKTSLLERSMYSCTFTLGACTPAWSGSSSAAVESSSPCVSSVSGPASWTRVSGPACYTLASVTSCDSGQMKQQVKYRRSFVCVCVCARAHTSLVCVRVCSVILRAYFVIRNKWNRNSQGMFYY